MAAPHPVSVRCLGRGGTCAAVVDIPIEVLVLDLRTLPAVGRGPVSALPGWWWLCRHNRAELYCPDCESSEPPSRD